MPENENTAEYAAWIERERRLRIKILKSSLVITKEKIFRFCSKCEEICLCHEEICPNCNSSSITTGKMDHDVDDDFVKQRIRCLYRYSQLAEKQITERQ